MIADEALRADALASALGWLDQGRPVALASVVQTWGSSPRPAGSLLAVTENLRFAGSVSGGCVEAAVIEKAAEVLAGAKPTLLEFGVSDEQAWEVGLACGGRIRVYVERADPAVVRALAEAREQRRALARVVSLADGGQFLFDGRDAPPAELAEPLREALRQDQSLVVEGDRGETFIQVVSAPLRLLIVGAVHIAQFLAPMAQLAGYRVSVIDPRAAFASEARFPEVELIREWPDKALRRLAPDARTAVVTLTHDPKLDEPALRAALDSPAFYIGALGSRRTQAARARRLAEAGVAEAQLSRIHGPVGLDLGGRQPGEIAVAILAEAIQTLRRPPRN